MLNRNAFVRPHTLGLPMVWSVWNVCLRTRGHAVWDRGVCDTPELWRDATGLCARVRVYVYTVYARVLVLVPRPIFTYIHFN